LNPFLSFFFNFIIYHLVDFELVFIFLFRFVFYEVISISNKHLRIWLVLNFFSVYFYFIISLSENIFLKNKVVKLYGVHDSGCMFDRLRYEA
jgi:hypothetical protein